MDSQPLVTDQTDAGTRLIAEFGKAYPVEAAFWMRGPDEEQSHLYLASPGVSDATIPSAYREAMRILAENPSPWLGPFEVKLIGADDPLARAAIELGKRYRGRVNTRITNGRLGGVPAAEAYIYNLPITDAHLAEAGSGA